MTEEEQIANLIDFVEQLAFKTLDDAEVLASQHPDNEDRRRKAQGRMATAVAPVLTIMNEGPDCDAATAIMTLWKAHIDGLGPDAKKSIMDFARVFLGLPLGERAWHNLKPSYPYRRPKYKSEL